jgi:hypothetical protein
MEKIKKRYKEPRMTEMPYVQCQRGGGYKLQGPGSPEGGPRAEYVAYVFVLICSIRCN